MEHDDVVVLTVFNFRHEAELAASVLRGHGIQCAIRDGFFAGVDPVVMFTSGGVPLLVREEDREESARILQTVDGERGDFVFEPDS